MDISYCPYCGSRLDDGDETCTECGAVLQLKDVQLKVPAVSVILSAFFPGLGQIYNGDRLSKGLIIFFIFFIGSLFWFLPGIIVWIFGMYDAYKNADLIQRGKTAYRPVLSRDLFLMIFIPLVVMLVFLAVTIYGIYLLYGSPEQMLYEMMNFSRSLETRK